MLDDAPQVLDTRSVDPPDRIDAVGATIWSNVVRVEIAHHPEPGLISALGSIADVGPINVCSVRSNATTVRRTARLSRDDMEPSVFVGLQVSGSSMVVQHGREAGRSRTSQARTCEAWPKGSEPSTSWSPPLWRAPASNWCGR